MDKNKVIDITWQIRRAEWKNKIQTGFQNVKNFVITSPEIALPIASAIVGAVGWGVKTLVKANHLRKATKLHDEYCYDRSLGHYWKLRRELTNSEWVEIDKRKKNGERLADILDSLKVLK